MLDKAPMTAVWMVAVTIGGAMVADFLYWLAALLKM
jgi:hypothetical protein